LDRITHRIAYDGYRGGRLLCGTGARRSARDNHVDIEPSQFGRQAKQPLDVSIRASVLNDDVLTLDIAELTQSLPKGIAERLRLRRFKGPSYQVTYPCNFPSLLRARAERPCGRRTAY